MRSFRVIPLIIVLQLSLVAGNVNAQIKRQVQQTIDAGVATIDITPETPIRLTGYGAREKSETTDIMHRLEGKALAIGSDQQKPLIIITVDLLGITERVANRVRKELQARANIDPAQVGFMASHTHGGPELGNAINILQYRSDERGYTDSLLELEQLIHIAEYNETLVRKLTDVALTALSKRTPGYISWGQGQAGFAKNRRPLGGPVDVALPALKVTNTDGTLRAIFLNYACHGTTLEGINQINGDWISEAKKLIEARHPGALAMVALGCGADADPSPRGNVESVQKNGKEIADNAEKLIRATLQPIETAPTAKMVVVKLPFAKTPTVPELIEQARNRSKKTTLYALYARIALDQIQRGESLPTEVDMPVQVWSFGDGLAMVNLGGEVTVDYSLRLKNEMGAERLWVNGYANDVPCYIASARVIREGGYEADFSMTCYNKPSPLKEEAENIIIKAVYDLIPEPYKNERAATNQLSKIEKSDDGNYYLTSAKAGAAGQSIKYMPEWKAFGWFNTTDQAEWEVETDQTGKYDVYLDYSVSDAEAGKSFVFESGSKKLKGKLGTTGSWYTYSKKKLGTLTLSKGTHKMVFKSNNTAEKGAMLDLSELVLVPVK